MAEPKRGVNWVKYKNLDSLKIFLCKSVNSICMTEMSYKSIDNLSDINVGNVRDKGRECAN